MKERKYVAEGNVIVSTEEFNKLDNNMKALARDRKELEKEQNDLNQAIKDNMFLTTTHHSGSMLVGYMPSYRTYDAYELSDKAEEILKPVLEDRLKEAKKTMAIENKEEFSRMSIIDFIIWRKDYRKLNLTD